MRVEQENKMPEAEDITNPRVEKIRRIRLRKGRVKTNSQSIQISTNSSQEQIGSNYDSQVPTGKVSSLMAIENYLRYKEAHGDIGGVGVNKFNPQFHNNQY